MAKRLDPFFYNSRTGEWWFFGAPESDLTGMQSAYILSMDDHTISEYVKDDVLVLPGRPFMRVSDKRFFKKLFVIQNYTFFVDVNNGEVHRVSGRQLENYVYTD